MPDRQWIIGCDRDVDLLVRDSVVSRRHCRLSLHAGQYFIEDLASRNGTFLGQQRVVTRTAIEPGMKIVLAGSILMPWPDENLATEKLRIGRSNSNEIVIDDESVSSQQAILFRDCHGIWIIRDLGSTNGTRVGESETLTAAARVSLTDVIHLGDVKETLVSLRQRVPASLPVAVDDGDDPPTLRDRSSRVQSASVHPSSAPAARQATTIVMRPRRGIERLMSLWQSKPSWVPVAAVASLTLIVLYGLWAVMIKSAEVDEALLSVANVPRKNNAKTTDTIAIDAAPHTTIAADSIEEAIAQTSARPSSAQPTSGTTRALSELNADVNPAIQSNIHNNLYWIVTRTAGKRHRLGCALAIDGHRLLTCASVVDQLQGLGTTAEPQCFHFASGSSVAIKATALHPRWIESRRIELQCNEWFQVTNQHAAASRHNDPIANNGVEKEASSEPNSTATAEHDRMSRTAQTARMLARVFDVGCIESAGPLPSHLSVHPSIGSELPPELGGFTSAQQPLRLLTSHRLLGVFSQRENVDFQNNASIAMHDRQVQPLFVLPRISTDQPPMYIGKTAGVAGSDLVFFGGVILDSQGRLAGMATKPIELDAASSPQLHRWVSATDVTFDWISVEVLAETIGNRKLSWTPR